MPLLPIDPTLSANPASIHACRVMRYEPTTNFDDQPVPGRWSVLLYIGGSAIPVFSQDDAEDGNDELALKACMEYKTGIEKLINGRPLGEVLAQWPQPEELDLPADFPAPTLDVLMDAGLTETEANDYLAGDVKPEVLARLRPDG